MTTHSQQRTLVPFLLFLLLLRGHPVVAAANQDEEANKALARRFYEEVWFSKNPAVVDELVAPQYIVHDIGNRKGLTELAEEQKRTAELFWQNGTMGGHLDFQIAERDLVATRWQWDFQPTGWWMRALNVRARNPLPIINVFRFRDGKIVEIWNHRHDIDSGFANLLFVQGFGTGLLSAGLVAVIARARRRHRVATHHPSRDS